MTMTLSHYGATFRQNCQVSLIGNTLKKDPTLGVLLSPAWRLRTAVGHAAAPAAAPERSPE